MQLIDLSHTVEHGMITYKGLPASIVCDYLSREESRTRYAPGYGVPHRPHRHGGEYRHLHRQPVSPLRGRH
jgi:hypothetical protein